VVLQLLIKQEIAIVLQLHGFEGSNRGTGKGFAEGLILLGILQGADQADHLATTWLFVAVCLNQGVRHSLTTWRI
jgi:hypothetical protein